MALKQSGLSTWTEATLLLDYSHWWALVYDIAVHFNVTSIPQYGIHNGAIVKSLGRAALSRRGCISIRMGMQQHTMPFEDGLIYDPEYPDTPITIDELHSMYPDWNIVDVSKEK